MPAPAMRRTLRIPSSTASEGSCGVDGVLVVTASRVAWLRATRSVNVPPVSTPARKRGPGSATTGLRDQGAQRRFEAGAGRLDEPRADLTDAGLAMGDAGVDLGQDPRLHHQPHVDPGGGPAEVEWGQAIGGVLPERDLVHEPRVAERIGGRCPPRRAGCAAARAAAG